MHLTRSIPDILRVCLEIDGTMSYCLKGQVGLNAGDWIH